MRKKIGLSKLEVVCVLSIFFVVFLVFHATANMSREHAKRQVCANNLRINATAIVNYAQEHYNYAPRDNHNFPWLQDLSAEKANDLMDYGANPYTFFCPSDLGYNTYKNPGSIQWTEYVSYEIISSYFWMMQNYTTPPSGSGDKQWIITIDVANPGITELLTDGQFSDGDQPESNYSYVTAGSLYVDYTNHRQGARGCAGGNIGFVDTHVQWRPFAEMEHRWSGSKPYHWW